jgi:dynactin-5
MIEDGAIVPPETVVPTFARFGGSPAKKVGELPENTQDIMSDFTKSVYQVSTHKYVFFVTDFAEK